ncbi:MAG: hypothetical protein C4340_06270, partial [Armatimonadota bacterium]
SGKISPDALAAVPRAIGTQPYAFALFRPYLPEAFAWDGVLREGKTEPVRYSRLLDALRRDLFVPVTGDLGSPDLLRTVVQEHVLLRALMGQTRVDYLRGRPAREVVAQLLPADGTAYVPGRIAYESTGLTFLNRGTYLQVAELGSTLRLRTALPPGVAEAGIHATDQVPLAQAWEYKSLP